MHPDVHATTRTPGPSTAEPVVYECRKPMSPDASAARTSPSDIRAPRSMRSSYGFFATSEIGWTAIALGAVESAVDDVHLLLAGQPDEVDRVAGDANGQTRVILGMFHGVDERLSIEHVDVHVEPGAAEVGVEDAGEVGDAIAFDAAQPL